MPEIALSPSLFTVFLSFSFQIHIRDKHKRLNFFSFQVRYNELVLKEFNLVLQKHYKNKVFCMLGRTETNP